MKVIINYQEYADVEIEKAIILEAFEDIEIIEHTIAADGSMRPPKVVSIGVPHHHNVVSY